MTAKRDAQDSAGSAGHDVGQLRRWLDWLILLPLCLLVLAILFLAAYSTSVTFRARQLETRTSAVNVPALRTSLDLVVAAALELEGLQQYALTGDTAYVMHNLEHGAARRRAAVELEPITPELTAEPRRHGRNLLRAARQWDSTLPDPADVAQLDPVTREQILADSRDHLRSMLTHANALHSLVRTEIDGARATLVLAERRVWYFMLGLAALALLASLLVIWLVRRVRRLAEVSRRRRIEVETAMENRARLIRGITHDLKNPLAAADGNAQLLEMAVVGKLTKPQVTTVQRIRRGIGGALGIVSDLLELSRAESGRLEVDIAPTDVAPILADATDDYGFRASAAGVAIRVDVPRGLPRAVTDGARVRQIMGNLLSNAVKHTPARGRITVSARVDAPPTPSLGGHCLALSVADTGPGVQPEERERIFDEFYRAKTATAGAGLGLGLAISRRIALLLGGDITVESEPGHGAVFTLWLPLAQDADRDLRVA